VGYPSFSRRKVKRAFGSGERESIDRLTQLTSSSGRRRRRVIDPAKPARTRRTRCRGLIWRLRSNQPNERTTACAASAFAAPITDRNKKLKDLNVAPGPVLYAEIADLTGDDRWARVQLVRGGNSPRAAPGAEPYNAPCKPSKLDLGPLSYIPWRGVADRSRTIDVQIPGRDLMIVTNTPCQAVSCQVTGSFAQRRIAECILPDVKAQETATAGRVFRRAGRQKMNRDATVLALAAA